MHHFSTLDKYDLSMGNGLIIDCCDKIIPLNENAFYYPVYLLGS